MVSGYNGHRRKRPVVVIVLITVLVALVGFGGYYFYNQLEGEGAYPLEYEDYIVKYAGESGIDPYLVAAVINEESGFDSEAISRVGAVGLMQIMPSTGEWIAGKLDVENFNEDMLLNPETNIRFGCWYLNFLDERFGGNKQLIMAGYNAGHNRVSAWLDDEEISDGESLIDIPFKETEDYVKKVEKSYEKYKERYEIG